MLYKKFFKVRDSKKYVRSSFLGFLRILNGLIIEFLNYEKLRNAFWFFTAALKYVISKTLKIIVMYEIS